MSFISNHTKATSVKIVSTVLIVMFSLNLNAADSGSSSSSTSATDTQIKAVLEGADALRQAGETRQYLTCEKAKQSLAESFKKISDACKKSSGQTVSRCVEKSLKCADTYVNESSTDRQDLATNLLNAGGTSDLAASVLGSSHLNNVELNKDCPLLSGKDYVTQRKDVLKELKDSKKEQADLIKEQAEINKSYNEESQKIDDELKDANEKLEEEKLKIKDDKRKQVTDFQEQQNKMKDGMRRLTSDILAKQGQLTQSQQDQTLRLIAMTDASGKRACLKAVADAKKAYQALASSSNSGHIAEAKQKRADLIALYDDCMSSFEQQRIALIKSKKNEQDQISKQITDAQTSLKEMENSLSTAQSQLAEIQQDTDTRQNNAQAKVTNLLQSSQKRLTTAYNEMQQKLQAVQQKMMNITQDINKSNNDLATMGPAPDKKSGEYSPADAAADITEASTNAVSVIGSVDSFNEQKDTTIKCQLDAETRKTFESIRKQVKSTAR